MNATQAIEGLRQALRRQHKALSTEDAYVFWLRRYLKALSAMDPALPSDKKVEAFLTQLARGGISASSQNQAFNAVLYFYKEILQKPLGRIDALRAKTPVHELQIKFNSRSAARLSVSDFHLFQLPNAVNFFDFFRIEFLQQFIMCVVGFCVDDDDVFGAIDGDPADYPVIAAVGWLRVDALKDVAGEAFAHLCLKNPLVGPVQELQAEVRNPEIRSGKRRHDLLSRQRGGGVVRQVLIGFSIGMDNGQFDEISPCQRFVDIEPIAGARNDIEPRGHFVLDSLSVADFEHASVGGRLLGLLFEQPGQ